MIINCWRPQNYQIIMSYNYNNQQPLPNQGVYGNQGFNQGYNQGFGNQGIQQPQGVGLTRNKSRSSSSSSSNKSPSRKAERERRRQMKAQQRLQQGGIQPGTYQQNFGYPQNSQGYQHGGVIPPQGTLAPQQGGLVDNLKNKVQNAMGGNFRGL